MAWCKEDDCPLPWGFKNGENWIWDANGNQVAYCESEKVRDLILGAVSLQQDMKDILSDIVDAACAGKLVIPEKTWEKILDVMDRCGMSVVCGPETKEPDIKKPCPFCHNTDDLMIDGNMMGKHWVFCEECGCCGPEASTSRDAVERWNKYAGTEKKKSKKK